MTWGKRIKAQISLQELAGVEDALKQAKHFLLESGHIAPMFSMDYLNSPFLFDVYQVEEGLSADPSRKDTSNIKKLRKKAHKSGKDAVKVSRKVAEKIPEALRLMGTFYWLENKEKKALTCWDKSIRKADHLGARPELARTYVEVGGREAAPLQGLLQQG